MKEQARKQRRRLIGTIVSDKMDKTVVVSVDRTMVHSRYLKSFTVSKKYKAHDPENIYKVGDKVVIEETRAMSKTKRWRVVDKVEKKVNQEISNE